MKTKEEIEKFVKDEYSEWFRETGFQTEGVQYKMHISLMVWMCEKCQEDMADEKYTELQLRFFADELIKGIEEKNKQGYEDIKVDYESLILSLNKQD